MSKCITDRYYDKEELTVEERKEIGAGDIRINQAKCLLCGDAPISHHRHDFKTCKCGNLDVDGGSWYLKRNAKDLTKVEEMSVYYKEQRKDGLEK